MKQKIFAVLLAVVLLCAGCNEQLAIDSEQLPISDEPNITLNQESTTETTESELENIENPSEIVEQKQILEPRYNLIEYDKAILDRAQSRIESNEMQEKINRWLEWISADRENNPFIREYIENEIKFNLANIYTEEERGWYPYYVFVKLRETNYDFCTADKSAEEIIEILWEKNIVWFHTYWFSLSLYGHLIGNDAKLIHYFFDSFEDMKYFVETTYISEIANGFLEIPFWGDSENLMRDTNSHIGQYGYLPFYSAEQYRITNVTDNQIDFIFSYAYHPWLDDEYVVFEIEYAAVKENDIWLLTDFVGVASFWSMYQEMQEN
jgi:hypothetical protein